LRAHPWALLLLLPTKGLLYLRLELTQAPNLKHKSDIGSPYGQHIPQLGLEQGARVILWFCDPDWCASSFESTDERLEVISVLPIPKTMPPQPLSVLGWPLLPEASGQYPRHRRGTDNTEHPPRTFRRARRTRTRGARRTLISFILFLCLAVSVALFLDEAPPACAASSLLPSDTGIKAYVEETWKTLPTTNGGTVSIGGVDSFCPHPDGRYIFVSRPDKLLVIDPRSGMAEVLANNSEATICSPWLGRPWDVAADSEGRIYVADALTDSVHVLDKELNYIVEVVIDRGGPWSVAVDSTDRLLVGVFRGSTNSRIQVFSWRPASNRTGRLEDDLVKTGEFKYNPPDEPPYCGMPYDIAVDSQDRIIIAESGTPDLPRRERVVVFDKDFKWVATLGSWGTEPGHLLAARSVAVGPGDIIMAAGGDDGWINFYFPNGTFAGQIGSYGHPLWRPKVFASTPDGKILARWSGVLRRVVIDWSTLTAINTTANTRPNGAVPETPLLAFPTLIGLTLLLAKKTSPPAQKRSIAKAMTSRS